MAANTLTSNICSGVSHLGKAICGEQQCWLYCKVTALTSGLFSLGFPISYHWQTFLVCSCYKASFGTSLSWHRAWSLLAIYYLLVCWFHDQEMYSIPQYGLPPCPRTNAFISTCYFFHILNWIPNVFYESAWLVWLHHQNQKLWPTLSGSACAISPGYFTRSPDQSESKCLRLFMGQSGQVRGPIIHP